MVPPSVDGPLMGLSHWQASSNRKTGNAKPVEAATNRQNLSAAGIGATGGYRLPQPG